ncbi:uncharacterized protein LOC143076182 isoform X2 [Mytilus galloprovincialis]|uniref:uncharacterized protein isoform X2 n=1 Tax=Mytilus edulis TaxID=6550 RepID=UPI0039EFA09A
MLSAIMFLVSLIIYTLFQVGIGQILPGTVPSLPNPTLEGCQKEAENSNMTSNYTSIYAKVIDKWCGTYDEVLPCLDLSLPYTRLANVNDWYLSMMFDVDIAHNISDDMCSKYKDYADDMECIDRSRRASSFCTQYNTKHLSTVILQLYYTNSTENPYADVNACLYANHTATCMTRHMKYCSRPIRKIINQYYRLLNGKCKDILYENKQEHINKTATAATTVRKQSFAEKVNKILQMKEEAKIKPGNFKETMTNLFRQIDPEIGSENATIARETGGNATSDAITLNQNAGNQTMELSSNSTMPEAVIPKKKKPKVTKKEKIKAEIKRLLQFVLSNA